MCFSNPIIGLAHSLRPKGQALEARVSQAWRYGRTRLEFDVPVQQLLKQSRLRTNYPRLVDYNHVDRITI